MTQIPGHPPDPAECASSEHVGRLHHDDTVDIWYECFWDPHLGVYTWAIIPPADEDP